MTLLPPLTAGIRWLRWLNYALVLIVVSILVNMLFERGDALQRDAEALALANIERGLKHAVFAESMRVLADSGAPALASRVGANPLLWADWPQRGPTDALAASDPSQVAPPPDGWRFEPGRGEVVYTPTRLSGGERRWRVEPVYVDDNHNGRFDPPAEIARELRLVALPGP